MGIRFSCPNGHKLNVKEALAGKRALCPECGAKVLIPNLPQDPPTAVPTTPVPAEKLASTATHAASATSLPIPPILPPHLPAPPAPSDMLPPSPAATASPVPDAIPREPDMPLAQPLKIPAMVKPAEPLPPDVQYQRRRERRRRNQVMFAVALLILVVALAIALVWVLWRNANMTPATTPATANGKQSIERTRFHSIATVNHGSATTARSTVT